MRDLQRLTGALLCIAGVALAAAALYLLPQSDDLAASLRAMREHVEAFGLAEAGNWKRHAHFIAGLRLVVGVLACVCGIGIVRRVESARLAWLATCAVILGVYLFTGFARGRWGDHLELLAFAASAVLFLRPASR
jgi:hypothetical protein